MYVRHIAPSTAPGVALFLFPNRHPSDKDSYSRNDLIGSCKITVAELKSDSTNRWPLMNGKYKPGGVKPRKGYKNSGWFYLADFEMTSNLTLKFAGKGLDAKDGKVLEKLGFATSDPYCVITRAQTPRPWRLLQEDGETWVDQLETFKSVTQSLSGLFSTAIGITERNSSTDTLRECHRTNTIMKVVDPQWLGFEITELELCANDGSTPITVSVHDYDRFTANDLIGTVTLTVSEIKAGKTEWPLINSKYQAGGAKPRPGYVHSGVLVLEAWEIEEPAATVDPNAYVDPMKGLSWASRGHWQSLGQKGADDNKLFAVKAGAPEYQDVSAAFALTCKNKVVRIERVENGAQHSQFTVHAATIKEKIGADYEHSKMHRLLFHGTQKEDVIQKILQDLNGFAPLLSGSATGAIWGDGTYFARDASYSNSYASKDAAGKKQLLVVEVAVGRTTEGKAGMKMMPLLPGEEFAKYDALTDNKVPPSIFVVQHSSQAYPAYVITYEP